MSGPLQNFSAFKGGEYVVVVTGKAVGTNSIRSSDMAGIHLPDPGGNRYDNDLDASMTVAEISHDDSSALFNLNPAI
ncbi:hypothetical protein [Paraburkholderia graminis]|uniref:hypothetical protein n=1 Tax=Paraburkholderia graminis TaxID=60548 RepID=UPI0038B83AC1